MYMYSSEFRRRRRASCWGCLGINVPRFQSLLFASPFLPRGAMLKRYLLSSCVRLSVRPSQAEILSKRLDESSWFLARRLPSTCPTPCSKEVCVPPKISTVYLYTVHRKSDSNGVYLAHPAAQSRPAGYMFCFCFFIYYFHDSCHTHYLKIYRTDLRCIFRIDRIMAAECR